MQATAGHSIEVVFTEVKVEFCEFAAGSQENVWGESPEFGLEFGGRAQAVKLRLLELVAFELEFKHGYEQSHPGRQAKEKAGRLADGTGDKSRIQG